MNILLAVDGSPCTKRMLAYVAAHDEWLGTLHRYVVVTAVPGIPPRAAAALDRETVKGFYGDEAEKVFKPILDIPAGLSGPQPATSSAANFGMARLASWK